MTYLGVAGHLKIVPDLFSHMDLNFISWFIDLISLEPKPLSGVSTWYIDIEELGIFGCECLLVHL
jgi:hypothetical protein